MFKTQYKCDDCDEIIWAYSEPEEWEHDCANKPQELQKVEDCNGCKYLEKDNSGCSLHKWFVADLVKCNEFEEK